MGFVHCSDYWNRKTLRWLLVFCGYLYFSNRSINHLNHELGVQFILINFLIGCWCFYWSFICKTGISQLVSRVLFFTRKLTTLEVSDLYFVVIEIRFVHTSVVYSCCIENAVIIKLSNREGSEHLNLLSCRQDVVILLIYVLWPLRVLVPLNSKKFFIWSSMP